MRTVATSLLGAAGVVFVVCRLAADPLGDPTWLGYVEAGAEAAMVGGLADWFAVVALFRHPLGIPVPHTAIVRRRKDEIGRNLGAFVQEHFLAAEQLVERVRDAKPADRVVSWVGAGNADRVAEAVLRAASTLAATVDDDEVRAALHEVVAEQLRAVPAAPFAARLIDAALADGRRDQLLEAALGGVVHVLDANRAPLRSRFGTESPWWVPEGVDERVFTRLYDGVRRLLDDMRRDPGHEVRVRVGAELDAVVAGLYDDPELAERVEVWRDRILASPELRAATASAWTALEGSIRRAADARPEENALRRQVTAAVAGAAERLAADTDLREHIDRAITAAVRAMSSAGGREVAALIATTVERWDAADTGARIELQIGRDLQFVRINGTVVGFLAGIGLHGAASLL